MTPSIEVVPNGNYQWTWLVKNEMGFPLHYGYCFGRDRARRKAERIARRYTKALRYTIKE